MAELNVSFLLCRLSDMLAKEAGIPHVVHEQIETIEGELKQLQVFLKDVEAKQRDEGMENWLRNVMDVSHRVEDVIDTFLIEEYNNPSNGHKEFCKKMELFTVEIQEILKQRPACVFGDTSSEAELISEALRDRIRSAILYEEQAVVGLDEDVKRLLARLIHPDKQLSVVSIVGMGGSGKTTLAKRIYCHDDVKSHFECCAWVYVSQKYKGRELLVNMAWQISEPMRETYEMMSQKDLEANLSEFLQEKRYLIVLDDVWDNQVWDELKGALPCGMKGSRILITTRNKATALYIDPNSNPHDLRLLDKEESWELLYKKIFMTRKTNLDVAKMEQLGINIVARYEGLPLALVEIGERLSREEKSQIDLLKVLQSENHNFSRFPERCLQTLALSYYQLPNHLKWCFLYCSIFPANYEIPTQKLLRLWIAEGFIHPRDGRTQQEVAEEYLEQLHHRSLIQSVNLRSDGSIKSCRVPQFLLEVAVLNAKKANFLDFYTGLDCECPTEARRVGIHSAIIPPIFSISGLRTVLLFEKYTDILEISKLDCIGDLQLIRVLDLECVQLSEVPHAIGQLIHLRYLGLKQTCLKDVSPVIGKLQNLQILDIGYNSIEVLPPTIFDLQSLQVLDARCNQIKELPLTISKLCNLKTLDIRSNQIKELPLTMPEIRNLQTLDVRRNFITIISSKITTRVRQLYMDQGVTIW